MFNALSPSMLLALVFAVLVLFGLLLRMWLATRQIRPDVSTQVRFRKEEEILKGEAQLRQLAGVDAKANLKILTSCPACLQGLSRFGEDLQNGLLEADYIVVEMANQILGDQWMPQYVKAANAGGIERVLV